MLKYALWADRITIKKAIGTSPFQLVYGTDVVFHVQLSITVMKFLQDSQEEPSDIQRRIYALIELQQKRGTVEKKLSCTGQRSKKGLIERSRRTPSQM